MPVANLSGLFGAPQTMLVNIRDHDCDVYIGRGSDWGNPYSHLPYSSAEFKVSSRDEAIAKYREYILKNEQLLQRLPELKGKVLGCHCLPKKCHGEVLISLLNSL